MDQLRLNLKVGCMSSASDTAKCHLLVYDLLLSLAKAYLL